MVDSAVRTVEERRPRWHRRGSQRVRRAALPRRVGCHPTGPSAVPPQVGFRSVPPSNLCRRTIIEPKEIRTTVYGIRNRSRLIVLSGFKGPFRATDFHSFARTHLHEIRDTHDTLLRVFLRRRISPLVLEGHGHGRGYRRPCRLWPRDTRIRDCVCKTARPADSPCWAHRGPRCGTPHGSPGTD